MFTRHGDEFYAQQDNGTAMPPRLMPLRNAMIRRATPMPMLPLITLPLLPPRRLTPIVYATLPAALFYAAMLMPLMPQDATMPV